MKKSIILVLAVLMLLSVMLTGCNGFQSLSDERKAEIEKAYKIQFCDKNEETYQKEPLVWFDENGGAKEPGVVRYFSTYGDCIVMLRYKDEGTAEKPHAKTLFWGQIFL